MGADDPYAGHLRRILGRLYQFSRTGALTYKRQLTARRPSERRRRAALRGEEDGGTSGLTMRSSWNKGRI